MSADLKDYFFPLSSFVEIEQLASPEVQREKREDSVDYDLDLHVHSFLHSVGKTLQLSNMNIESPEDARDALKRISELKVRVEQHRRTARALKQLLSNTESCSEDCSASYC